MDTQVVAIEIWPLAIPLRRPFEHAACRRSVAEPLVVQVELANGVVGFGEALPRPYVTGETAATVEAAIKSVLLDALVPARPKSMAEALEIAESLPWHDQDGQPCNAARAAVELALLDAYGKAFGRSVGQMAGWFGTPGFGPPGSLRKVTAAGVLGMADPSKLRRSVRLMRCYGLRDFKLKVGGDDPAVDSARLDAVLQVLGRALKDGRATLRIDANGAWEPEVAAKVLSGWKDLPIAAVEQPCPPGTEPQWQQIASACGLPLFADESLTDMADARYLAQLSFISGFNIRISKNGGLTAAVRLAEVAKQAGLQVLAGCMVGETGILSAAFLHFLSIVDNATYAEGCYGRWLLRSDVCRRRVRFGFGGRLPAPAGPGLGISVDPDRLRRFCSGRPIRVAP